MAKTDLTAERLRQIFDYDPETGVFTRKLRAGRAGVGAPVGWPVKRHLAVQIDGYNHYLHRLAWLYVHGEWPKDQIDHINGDASDNRIANLRDVHRSLNQQNLRKPNRQNKTGFLGVCYYKANGKYQAHITVSSKRRALGFFDTPEQAYEAYLNAKRRLHKGCTI